LAQRVTTRTGEHGTVAFDGKQKTREAMRVLVSLLLLAAGIVILVSPNRFVPTSLPEPTKCIAAGWIGAVIGYWLS
jgi:hypothetical protein